MSSRSLLPWWRLCRFPTVFTALADICLGYLLTHEQWTPLSEFLTLLGASAGLYLSGMVFNDVFDLKQDQAERPWRPLPSGAISLLSAVIFGSLLMFAGILCSLAVGINSLLVSLLIAVAILAYDGGLKKTSLGPLAMGTCRFLNILLGASSGAESFADVWAMPQLWMAVAMGLYVTGVTWFARTEARSSRKLSLAGALGVLDLGLLLLAAWMFHLPERIGLDLGPVAFQRPLPVLLLWGAIAASINRRAIRAIADPIPARVQPAIGSMLLSIISIDAMMIYFRLGPPGLVYCVWTLALLIPAVFLRKWIPMT